MFLIHPCPCCQSNELYYIRDTQNIFCPICDKDEVGLFIVSKDDTKEIINSWLMGFEQAIEQGIHGNFEKYSLMTFLVTCFNSIFNLKTPVVPITEWFAVITLLKWVNNMPVWCSNSVQLHWAYITNQKVSKLTNLVTNYNLVKQWSFYCKEEYNWGSLFSRKKNIDIVKLKEESNNLMSGTFSNLIEKFDLIWLRKFALKTVIEPSLAEKGIAIRSLATEKYFSRINEYEEAIKTVYVHPENLDVFLKRGGVSFSTYTSLLSQNELWSKTFDINYDLSEKDLDSLFNFYFRNQNSQRILKKTEFLDLMQTYNINHELLNILLLSEENPSALPFFIQIADSHVIYSHRNFYFLFMYLIAKSSIGKEYLQQSFIKDGEEFEKKIVPKLFENELKMNSTNLKIKKLQVDLIAYNNNIIFVIETKRWDFKPFLTLRKRLEDKIRDLKGIVDGVKYTTKDAKLSSKKIPSLLEKVEYVEQNRKNLTLPDVKVVGLVITRLFPPFWSYKNCLFLSYEEVNEARISELMDSVLNLK